MRLRLRRGRTLTETVLLVVWPSFPRNSVRISGRTARLNEPSAAVWTVATVRTSAPLNEGRRCSLIVTASRNTFPTSTDVTVYVFVVAPMMFAQLAPLVSHRRHWKANVIG